MNQLSRRDVLWIASRLPKDVFDILKSNPGSVFLAGGFIRACIANEEVNDIDLFASSKEKAAQIADSLTNQFRKRFDTENAYTVTGLKHPVQIIHRWTFETPQQCVESFDFTIARAAIWVADVEKFPASICDPGFYEDLAGKRLVYRSPQRNEDAGGSLLRVLKFYQRGYRIPLDSLGAVTARLIGAIDFSKIGGPWNGAATMEDQIAKVVTGLLREVDPNVDPQHVSHLPSIE